MACILVVDDNQDTLRLLKSSIESDGHHVMIASDGQDAILIVDKFQPDLLILDICMPRVDGYEVFQMLRLENRRIPIILMTSTYGSMEEASRGLALGAEEYVVKPFSCALMMYLIQRVLRKAV